MGGSRGAVRQVGVLFLYGFTLFRSDNGRFQLREYIDEYDVLMCILVRALGVDRESRISTITGAEYRG